MKITENFFLVFLLFISSLYSSQEDINPTINSAQLTTKMSLENRHKDEERHLSSSLEAINAMYQEIKKNHEIYQQRAHELKEDVKKPTANSHVKELYAIAVAYLEQFSILEKYWHEKLDTAQKELHKLEEAHKKQLEEE